MNINNCLQIFPLNLYFYNLIYISLFLVLFRLYCCPSKLVKKVKTITARASSNKAMKREMSENIHFRTFFCL